MIDSNIQDGYLNSIDYLKSAKKKEEYHKKLKEKKAAKEI